MAVYPTVAPIRVITTEQVISESPPFSKTLTKLSIKSIYGLFSSMQAYVKEVLSFPKFPLLGIKTPFYIAFQSSSNF